MAQSRSELEVSKIRLQSAIKLLNDELRQVQLKLDGLIMPEKLDDAFFWDRLSVIISESDYAMTGSQLISVLENRGITVSDGNFRTFLSRKKSQGLLELKSSSTGKATWILTKRAKEIMRSLGGKSSNAISE